MLDWESEYKFCIEAGFYTLDAESYRSKHLAPVVTAHAQVEEGISPCFENKI